MSDVFLQLIWIGITVLNCFHREVEIINTRSTIGLILIVLGLVIFLGNMNIISGDYTLFIIGGGFLLAYYLSAKSTSQRKVGLLIAALLILMTGLFDIADNYVVSDLAGSLFFMFLGTAFILIYILHTMHIDNGKQKWPLYTSVAIYAFSLFIYLVEVVDLRIIENIAERYWPIIFIIIGARILFKGIGERKTKSKETKDKPKDPEDKNKDV